MKNSNVEIVNKINSVICKLDSLLSEVNILTNEEILCLSRKLDEIISEFSKLGRDENTNSTSAL